MGKPARVGLVSAIVLALICGGIYAFNERSHVAEATPPGQEDPIVSVDANPAGNTGISLGTINGCISVESVDTGPGVPGPTFYIDLVIQEVTNLNAWDATFEFDQLVLEVNSQAVANFFLGSNVYNPFYCYGDGVCTVGGGDQSGAGHTGEGVLGRLEITAIGPGISKVDLDLRPPASMVILRYPDGTIIGDDDGDGFFDGDILNAEIAVDQPCPGECQPDVDSDGDGFNDDVECYLPTDQNDDCTDEIGVHDAWPLDVNMDTAVTVVADVLPYSGKIGLPVAGDPILQRLDLNTDGAITVVGDVLAFRGHIGESCT